MKKAFTVILIALLAVSFAFANGGKETGSSSNLKYDGITINMYSMWNASEPQGQMLQKAADEFKEETGATVNIEFMGRDLVTIISTALQGGEDIDIFEDDYTRIAKNYSEYVYDLTDMAAAAGYNDFSYPVFRNMMNEWAGFLCAIPMQANMGGIFYDKAKFEAAGITETPTTWDEYLDVCQQLVDAGFQPLALDATYSDFNFGFHLERYIGEAATAELSQNGGWSKNPAVAKAADDIIDFVNRGYLADGAPDEYPSSQNKIGFENVAMIVCADYVTAEVNNNTGANIDWGVFNYPVIPVEQGGSGLANSFAGNNAMAITSYSEHPQVAFDFMMKVASGDIDQERAKMVPQIPVDPRNECTSLEGAVEALSAAESTLSWAMGVNQNGDLKSMIKEVIIKLYEGRYQTGEEFAAALDALYR